MQSDPRPCAAYCLFCTTGIEQALSREIIGVLPEAEAYPVLQQKFVGSGKKKAAVIKPMLNGYIFIFRQEPLSRFELSRIKAIHGALRFLGNKDDDWRLSGQDLAFSAWVKRYSGFIGLSKIFAEGDEIQVLEGPLRDMRGKIMRLDKRSRCAKVRIDFDSTVITAWIAFDWVSRDSAALSN